MRHLFVPACCLTLLTWSSALGPEPSLAKLFDATQVDAAIDADIDIADGSAATDPGDRKRIEADREATLVSTGYADQYEIPDPVAEAVPAYLKPLNPIVKPIIPRSRAEICETLTSAAHRNDLPAPFFIRLLYQESGFRPGIVSPAGAEGVAQFLPETAADRGLDNPFDPVQAIAASASLLRDLAHRFGNLGLAAAAYNAGPKRVMDWLAKKAKLPQETQNYVKTITGRPAGNWTAAETGSPAIKLPRYAPCQEAAGLLAWDGPDRIPMPPTRDATRKNGPAQGNAMLVARAKAGAKAASKRETRTAAADVKATAKEPAKQHGAKIVAGKKHRPLHLSER